MNGNLNSVNGNGVAVETHIMKSEFPSVPIQTENFAKTFLDAIWHHFSSNPSRPALINGHDEADRVTFGQLYIYSQSIAAFLKKRGFGHRDVACLVMQNCWEYMAIFGGVILRGGVLSGASHVYTSYELQKQFEDSCSSVVFTSEACLQRVLEAIKSNPLVKTIVFILTKHDVPPHPSSDSRVINLSEVLREHPIVDQPTSEGFNAETEIMILPYSSGTTGAPKGVMISHKNFGSVMNMWSWQFNNKIFNFMDKHYDYYKETLVQLLPFYHIYGFASTVNQLLNGSTVVVMKSFEPNLLCTHLQNYKCRVFLLVPPIMIFFAKSPVVENYDLSHLRMILSGAAPAGSELLDELRRRFPAVTVAQGYGMTEVSICSHLPIFDGVNRDNTVGKLMPNMEQKIVDVKTGEPIMAKKTPGELYLRGPNVMMGYLGRPDTNAETIDADGWLRTGDIGYVDDEGFLCIVDRLKELIKVRGFQVAPAELEDILLSMPKVRDCAVIGIPDASSGEIPIAFIVSDDESLKEDDVQNYIKERLAHYKQLKGGVRFVDEIPKSTSGKIMRRVLRDNYVENAGH